MCKVHQNLSCIIEYNVTEREQNTTLIDNIAMCLDCKTRLISSESVYVEHELVESEEEPEFCAITIIKEDEKPEIGITGRGSATEEGKDESEEVFDSSSTKVNLGDSDDDLSDVDMGDVDLDDILEAERTEDREGRQILKEFENENFWGDSNVDSPNSASTSQTPHFPPGLQIWHKRVNFFNTDCDVDEDHTPKINGVHVRMREVELTDAEIDLYSDPVYGHWRAKQPSPLRMCWLPGEPMRSSEMDDVEMEI